MPRPRHEQHGDVARRRYEQKRDHVPRPVPSRRNSPRDRCEGRPRSTRDPTGQRSGHNPRVQRRRTRRSAPESRTARLPRSPIGLRRAHLRLAPPRWSPRSSCRAESKRSGERAPTRSPPGHTPSRRRRRLPDPAVMLARALRPERMSTRLSPSNRHGDPSLTSSTVPNISPPRDSRTLPRVGEERDAGEAVSDHAATTPAVARKRRLTVLAACANLSASFCSAVRPAGVSA